MHFTLEATSTKCMMIFLIYLQDELAEKIHGSIVISSRMGSMHQCPGLGSISIYEDIIKETGINICANTQIKSLSRVVQYAAC